MTRIFSVPYFNMHAFRTSKNLNGFTVLYSSQPKKIQREKSQF